MMFTYSRLLISDEDYYLSAWPKKVLFGFFSCYSVASLGIFLIKQSNPEIFYRKILISPAIVAIMTLSPIIAVYGFTVKHAQISRDIYMRTVGHLTDREMLELECKINPNRRFLYAQAFEKHDQETKKIQDAANSALP